MSTYTFKQIRQPLTVIAICLGASVAANADHIALQTNFQLPANLGIYATGSDLGSSVTVQVDHTDHCQGDDQPCDGQR